jgi:hypothetical protein
MKLDPEVVRWFAAAHAGSMPSNQESHTSARQFEYMDTDLDAAEPSAHLNALGQLGWELVSVVTKGNAQHAYLKRLVGRQKSAAMARE